MNQDETIQYLQLRIVALEITLDAVISQLGSASAAAALAEASQASRELVGAGEVADPTLLTLVQSRFL
jgi:hypothetical protein